MPTCAIGHENGARGPAGLPAPPSPLPGGESRTAPSPASPAWGGFGSVCPPRMLQLLLCFAAPTSVLPVVLIRRHKGFWKTAGGTCPRSARGVLSLGVFQGQSWHLGVPQKAAVQPPWGAPHVLCPTDTKPPASPGCLCCFGLCFPHTALAWPAFSPHGGA